MPRYYVCYKCEELIHEDDADFDIDEEGRGIAWCRKDCFS